MPKDDSHWGILELRTPAGVRLDWRTEQAMAIRSPPKLPGLLARTLRSGRSDLALRYIFDDDTALERFRGAPDVHDPSLQPLRCEGPFSERIDAISGKGISELFDRPIFILSAPRSGSTLLYDLLIQSDGIWSLRREMQSILEGIPSLNLQNRRFTSHRLGEEEADASTAAICKACILTELSSSRGERYLDLKAPAQPHRVRFLDKTPENALRIPFLCRLFPDALFIFLHRDPRQSVSSIVEAWAHPGFVAIPDLPGFARADWCFLLPENWQRQSSANLSEIAAFQWYAANHAILQELETLPQKRWTTISYEDLVAAPMNEIRRLCDFVGVDPGPRLNEALGRELPLSDTTISGPSPTKWLTNRKFDPKVIKRLQPLAGRIRSLTVNTAPPVLRASFTTSVRFSNFVDDYPADEVPADAIVSPSLLAQAGSAAPLAIFRKVRHRERFLSDYPLLWIEDPATTIWCPYWLRRHQYWLCSALRPGDVPPEALTGRLCGQMVQAGLLTSHSRIERRALYGQELRDSARDALERDRYCVLPQLLDAAFASALAAYYRHLIRTGEWPLGDAQVERRYGWHNERLASFVHHQLTDFLSDIAGRRLKPTYCFASAYQGGAALDAHMDREQCDYTLSLLIDEKRSSNGDPWLLYFQAPRGAERVALDVCSGAFFRGCELAHWRNEAAPDQEQTNLLLHYVPFEWQGVLD